MANEFRKYQPLSLRVWHWLNALVILSLLATVLLRKTFLSWRTNSALIEEKLRLTGVTITPELAKEVAVAIRNPLWDWHIYFGFTLAGLLMLRIAVFMFVQRRQFLKPGSKTLHYRMVKTGYVVFYLVTAVMVGTGMALYFKADLGLAKALADGIKEVHELVMWFFVVFTAGHIAGVVIAENRHDPGLVSDMIHGGPSEK